MLSKKKSIVCVRVGYKNLSAITVCHHRGKPRDAKLQSSGQIFLSAPHTHDGFLLAEISASVRNSYLTHVILPRLS